jgi:hypothetical protein
VKLLLTNFHVKVAKKEIFASPIRNDWLHESISDDGIRVIDFGSWKNLMVKITIFPHRNVRHIHSGIF